MSQRITLERHGVIITETPDSFSIAGKKFDSDLTGGSIGVHLDA